MRSNTKGWHQAFWTAGTVALLLAAGLAYAQQPAPRKQAPAAQPQRPRRKRRPAQF